MIDKISPCPMCGQIPEVAYSCGEYFIVSQSENKYCLCNRFYEMHASESQEIECWNRACTDSLKMALRDSPIFINDLADDIAAASRTSFKVKNKR